MNGGAALIPFQLPYRQRRLSLYFHWKFFRPITYSAMTTIGTKYLKIGFIQS